MGIELALKSLENRDKEQQRIISDLKQQIKQLEEEIVNLEWEIDFLQNELHEGKGE